MLVEEQSGGAVDDVDAWSSTEPRHGDRSRLLRLLHRSADHRVTDHWTVHVETLRQDERLGITHMQAVVQSTRDVTLHERISCSRTLNL